MNSELTRAALEKVGNPNILVNLVSRRVRQLNAGGGAGARPLVEGADHLGAADVALREIVEDKLTYEQVPSLAEELVPARKRRRH
ncbi:MAG: DNA-directed RNA polymerase subunit omega [Verrucomicrobia bacterium]|nr:DNA-directed RNA polymerase subunit omega [Verrucomicrobiota bacterium]